MSSTAPTHDGFEACFRCDDRAICTWKCRFCPRHIGPYALCRACSLQPCPNCRTHDFDIDALSSLPESSDGISFVTDNSDLADRIRDRLQGTSSWLSAHEIARALDLHQTRDVNQALYMMQRIGAVRVREDPSQVPRWQLPQTTLAVQEKFKNMKYEENIK